MEPIRVLNLFTIMNRGGAETMVMNYYRNMDRTKVQFDFLVHREEKGAYEDEIIALGGKIYRGIPIYPRNFYKYKKFLKHFFSDHQEYKIIHAHMSELGYFAFKEAKKQKYPIRICHAHNASRGFDAKTIVRSYFKKRITPYLTQRFICGLESGNCLFGKKYEDQFIMMNNAIDAKKFSYNNDTRNRVRKLLNLENNFVVGHIGRFNKQKNHDFLIDIFAEILKRNKNAILLLVGSGNLEEQIKSKINKLGLNEAIKFLNSRDDVHELLQAFDAFILPSLFEGLPVTIIEAQAAGLKCFISDTISKECCITENVEIISLKSSPKLWAEQIIKSSKKYERKDLFNEIEKAGYDIKKNAQWLEEFYLNEYRQTTTNDIYTGI